MSTKSMRKDDPRFVVRATPSKGSGLFATKPLVMGEFLLEYVGHSVPTRETDGSSSRYLFEVDGTEWTIDGEVPENLARFINHACEPNTEAIVADRRIDIYASRDIAAGEELTLDYGQEYFDEFIGPEGCKCGATKHRS